jgi:hypothetical protein
LLKYALGLHKETLHYTIPTRVNNLFRLIVNRVAAMPPKIRQPVIEPRDTLPSTTLIPNSALLRRFLTRLPKPILIDLIVIWLDHPLCPFHQPGDGDEDDIFRQESENSDEKKAIYEAYRDDDGVTKKAIIERVLGVDWVRCCWSVSHCSIVV